MKKKLFVAAVCVLTMAGLTACGGSSVSYDKYDLDEYIKVGEYKGLTVAGYKVEVTDDEIDTRIEKELEEQIALQEKALKNEQLETQELQNQVNLAAQLNKIKSDNEKVQLEFDNLKKNTDALIKVAEMTKIW